MRDPSADADQAAAKVKDAADAAAIKLIDDAAVTDEALKHYRPVLLSGYDRWMRKFLMFLAIVQMALTVLMLLAVGKLKNSVQEKPSQSHVILCAIATDINQGVEFNQVLVDNGCPGP